MTAVFEKSKISGMVLPNRIIRSATHEGLGNDEGHVAAGLELIYEKLAQGRAGAIITGNVAVHPGGRTLHNMPLFSDDGFKDDYRFIEQLTTKYETPVILQLSHGGGRCLASCIDGQALAPSAVKVSPYPDKPQKMSGEDIEEVIDSFAAAAVRAKDTGFSGVQFHAAHGYLLYQFLSRRFNRRSDQWGGSLENRSRIICRILQESRKRTGNFPLLVKLSAFDFCKNGMRVNEAIEIAQRLEKAGCDGIEISSGCGIGFDNVRVQKVPSDAVLQMIPWYAELPAWKKRLLKPMMPLTNMQYKTIRNYTAEATGKIREAVNIPVIISNGIRTLSDIESFLTSDVADYAAMCRPFIMESDIVKKFQETEQNESRCIECGLCFLGVTTNKLRCYAGKIPRKQIP